MYSYKNKNKNKKNYQAKRYPDRQYKKGNSDTQTTKQTDI